MKTEDKIREQVLDLFYQDQVFHSTLGKVNNLGQKALYDAIKQLMVISVCKLYGNHYQVRIKLNTRRSADLLLEKLPRSMIVNAVPRTSYGGSNNRLIHAICGDQMPFVATLSYNSKTEMFDSLVYDLPKKNIHSYYKMLLEKLLTEVPV